MSLSNPIFAVISLSPHPYPSLHTGTTWLFANNSASLGATANWGDSPTCSSSLDSDLASPLSSTSSNTLASIDFLLADEASQLPVAHVVASLSSGCIQGLILIGDHQQLGMPTQGGKFAISIIMTCDNNCALYCIVLTIPLTTTKTKCNIHRSHLR